MGASQKAFGDLFENLFERSCRWIDGMAITRFPDGCRVVGKNKLIPTKTMCDWVITYKGSTALIDTKTTESDSFPHSKIESHQLVEMTNHSNSGGVTGYVIWYRKSDDVVFLSSMLLIELLHKRGSIKYNAGYSRYLGKSSKIKPQMLFGISEVFK